MEGLEYKTQRFVTESRQLLIFHSLGVRTINFNRPRCRCIKQPHDIQQRGFTTSGRSHNTQKFPAFYCQVHIFQCDRFDLVRTVNLGKRSQCYHNYKYLIYSISYFIIPNPYETYYPFYLIFSLFLFL